MTEFSIHTNMGAMVALQSLNRTGTGLAAAQKQISTGYRVSDAFDNGAAFALAQTVRSEVSGLTSANQQLGNAVGILQVTNSALTNVSNTMTSMKAVLVKLSDSSMSTNEQTQYIQQYSSYLANVKSFIQDASYNGKSLVNSFNATQFGSVNVVRNEIGSSVHIGSNAMSKVYNSVTFTASIGTAAKVASLLTAGGTYTKQFNLVGSYLNAYGSDNTYVNNQVTYNSDKIDALNTGLGALIDANMAKESAKLQALQVQQQLGTQALSIANQAPQTLLSLFR